MTPFPVKSSTRIGTTIFAFVAAANVVESDTPTLVLDTPACVTVKVWPVTVIVPVRWLALVLVATVNAMVLLPLPLPPELIVSQLTLLTAVQVQPPCAVMMILPVLLVAGKD